MAICACNFYDNPSRKFKLIGVTGTKGKTTTTFMMREIFQKQGIKERETIHLIKQQKKQALKILTNFITLVIKVYTMAKLLMILQKEKV